MKAYIKGQWEWIASQAGIITDDQIIIDGSLLVGVRGLKHARLKTSSKVNKSTL